MKLYNIIGPLILLLEIKPTIYYYAERERKRERYGEREKEIWRERARALKRE